MPDVSHERNTNNKHPKKKKRILRCKKPATTREADDADCWALPSAHCSVLFCFFFVCCPIQFMWIKYQSEPKPIHYFIETICFFGCCGINAGALSVFFFFHMCDDIPNTGISRIFATPASKKNKYENNQIYRKNAYAGMVCGIGRETNRQHGCLGKWPLAVMSMEICTIWHGMHWVRG